MEKGGSLNGKKMDNDKWNMDSMMKEERDRRSRSPLDKKRRSTGASSSNGGRRGRGRSRSPQRRTRAPTNRRIYVANIPYDCKWTGLKDFFREKVGEVSYVELFEDESGKFRGCGIVEFKDSSSVQKAVDLLHRYDFKGRQLVVKEDFDVDRDKTGKPVGRGGRGDMERRPPAPSRQQQDDFGGAGAGGGAFNTYGLSPQFLDALRITGPLTPRIFVANLDYKVTPQKLEEVFRLAGKVVQIDLKRDDDGNSKGHGTIEMGHPVEAVQAISMFNGQKFYNRIMSVRMDKKTQDDPEDKRLPEGLQSVGKGLGANGLPLHLSNSSSSSMGGSLPPAGIPPVGGGVSAVGGLSGGAPLGLSSIGMSLQERGGFSGGLGGSSSLLASSVGGLGGLASAAPSAPSLAAYSAFERSAFDRHDDDGYRSVRATDSLVNVRNKFLSSLQDKDLYAMRDYDRSRRR